MIGKGKESDKLESEKLVNWVLEISNVCFSGSETSPTPQVLLTPLFHW